MIKFIFTFAYLLILSPLIPSLLEEEESKEDSSDLSKQNSIRYVNGVAYITSKEAYERRN